MARDEQGRFVSDGGQPASGRAALGDALRPWKPGNVAAQTHGAYALLSIQGRAHEIAEQLTAAMVAEELWRPTFAPTVQVLAVVLVRVERAAAAIAQVDEAADNPLGSYVGDSAETVSRLREDLRRWTNTSRSYFGELGFTPSALARIAKDTGIGKATRAEAAVRALNDHVAREHGNRRSEVQA